MPVDEMTVRAGSHLTRQGFRGIPGESRLRPMLVPKDTTTRYYTREPKDAGYISEVVVLNPKGDVFVFTPGPDGEQYRWGCRHTGVDEITFYPHPAYKETDLPIIHFEKWVQFERIYMEPTKVFSFAEEPNNGQ
jgi:hypothetical protein